MTTSKLACAAGRSTLALCIAMALGASSLAVASGSPQAEATDGPMSGSSRSAWHADRGRRQRVRLVASATAKPNAIIQVANCNDSGSGSLRAVAALSGAVVADLSALTCSTISLTSGAIEVAAQQLVLEGPGADALSIDGNYTDRVFVTHGNLTLDGVTVTHGAAPTVEKYGEVSVASGGCIKAGQSLVAVDSVISGCRAGAAGVSPQADFAFGGGIFAAQISLYDSTLENSTTYAVGTVSAGGGAYAGNSIALYGSTVINNTSTARNGVALGGGLYCEDGLTMTDSIVSGNSVESFTDDAAGGGISADYLTVHGSTISDNVAKSNTIGHANGGGVSSEFADLYYSTISGNTAQAMGTATGGGASVDEFSAVASAIQANSARSDADNAYGGGLAATGYSVSLLGSTISNNRVRADATGKIAAGGGLRTRHLRITNSTVANNMATSSAGSAIGGGIAVDQAQSQFYNATIANNSATTGSGGISIPSPGSNAYTPTMISTIVSGNSAAGAASGIGVKGSTSVTIAGDHDLVTSYGTLVTFATAPATGDPKLLSLADNGGPTTTMKLDTGSAAIDTGSNPTGRNYDQRGAPFARRSGDAVDIGAYEAQPDAGDIIFRNGFDPGNGARRP